MWKSNYRYVIFKFLSIPGNKAFVAAHKPLQGMKQMTWGKHYQKPLQTPQTHSNFLYRPIQLIISKKHHATLKVTLNVTSGCFMRESGNLFLLKWHVCGLECFKKSFLPQYWSCMHTVLMTEKLLFTFTSLKFGL